VTGVCVFYNFLDPDRAPSDSVCLVVESPIDRLFPQPNGLSFLHLAYCHANTETRVCVEGSFPTESPTTTCLGQVGLRATICASCGLLKTRKYPHVTISSTVPSNNRFPGEDRRLWLPLPQGCHLDQSRRCPRAVLTRKLHSRDSTRACISLIVIQLTPTAYMVGPHGSGRGPHAAIAYGWTVVSGSCLRPQPQAHGEHAGYHGGSWHCTK